MDLSTLTHLLYGILMGLSEIFPVSARAHSTLMMKVLGGDSITGLPALLIHIAILLAFFYSSQIQLVKMSRARKLARIPKRKRKRPLDLQSLLDLHYWYTMLIPLIPVLLLYRKIASIPCSMLVMSILLFVNGMILYIPQFLPGSNKDARSLSRVEGLLMGLGGALSVVPGLSGLGASVSVGSVCGVDRKYALNMSILMQMVFMAGLILFDILDMITVGFSGITVRFIIISLLAAAAAFFSTLFGVRIMRNLAEEAGYSFFAYYCWGIALFTFILNLLA